MLIVIIIIASCTETSISTIYQIYTAYVTLDFNKKILN